MFHVYFALGQNIHELGFEILDEEDGLSSHWIHDIALDSAGYLWVGTLDGLNRYDGFAFKSFKHKSKDPTSLLHDDGQRIYVTAKGEIWISYAKGGISLFEPVCQCFRHFNTPRINSQMPEDKYFGIRYIDKDGTVWLGGNGIGLIKYVPQTDQLNQYDLPFQSTAKNEKDDRDKNTVNFIHPAGDGTLWLCTQNGFYRFDPATKRFDYKQSSQAQTGFHKLIPESDKGFWLSSWSGGISYFDLKTETFQHFPLEAVKEKRFGYYNLIEDMAIKDEKTLWVVSFDQGLGVFDKQNGTFEFQYADPLHKLAFPNKILLLPGQAFFLVDENALVKYNPYAKIFDFKRLKIKESQHGDYFAIRKIMENPQANEMYFATEVGNGLNILNTNTQQITALPVETHPARDRKMRLFDLIRDQEGTIWLLSRDYLYEFDPLRRKLIKVVAPADKLPEEKEMAFKYFLEDSEKKLWILTHEGGIYPFLPRQRKLLPKLNQSRNGQQHIESISTATFDKQGNLWVQGNHALAYYPKGSSSCIFITDSLVSACLKGDIRDVKGMKTDTSGNVWVGISGKGLLKVDCQDLRRLSFRLFTTEEGLPSNRFNVMGTDFMGNVWISTLVGVGCMNTRTNQVKVFNQSVGMDKFTRGIRFLQGNNRRFYIASPGKYCLVDYDEMNRYIPPPKTYIANFKVLNVERKTALDGSQTLIMSPQENVFSFDFSCIDYTNQSHHEFAYMLEGWDKDWIAAGKRRYVGYTNLDGGHYTFKVKGKNGEGVWGNTVSIPIFIETPFYKQAWFWAMCMLLFVAGVYAVYRYRIGQIAEAERLKTEFNKKLAESRMQALRAQMNPHFIFNCLNSINRYIIKSDIKTASLYLTRFAKLIRLILDNSQHKTIPLADELAALKLYMELEAFRFEKKFSYEIEVDPNVDVDTIEIPPLLFQPYIENAIWHGLLHKETQGSLWIQLSQEADVLTCKITDNGIGREKVMEFKSKSASTRKSLGMKLTEERLHIAGDNESRAGTQTLIDLFDEQGNACGTQVVIKLYI